MKPPGGRRIAREGDENEPVARANPPGWLNRTVGGAGLTSALGDLCYETSTVILPGFFAVLGLPAALLGVIEGAADAVASFTKMAAGYIADKLGHRKWLVSTGYALTPLGQALIALAIGWPLLLAGRLVSWFGKGLRGPLRDAIVVQAVSPQTRGRAFGFHRAMDTVGAVVGPLLGVALLARARNMPWTDPSGPFRFVFWLTLIPGILAVLCFAAMVSDPGHTANPSLRFWSGLKNLPARFKLYLCAVALFGIGDFSHTLLILAATQLLAPSSGVVRAAQAAGVLYVVRNAVQAGASYPAGIMADRFGAGRVLAIGYLLGMLTAALAAAAFRLPAAGIPFLAALFTAAGLYMSVQEALEAVVTAEMVAPQALGMSYGALGTVNGSAKFVSSTMVGVLWTAVSPTFAFGLAAALMAAGSLVLVRLRAS